MLQRYNRAVEVTKSDTVNIAHPAGKKLTDALYVAGAGVTVVILEDDTVVSITAIAGAILPIAIKRVNSTTTASTGWVALYQV